MIEAMFKIRYHFQFKSLEPDQLWRSVLGHNDEQLARENFETERQTGAWANAIRLFDTELGRILLEEPADPTGGISLDNLSFQLASGRTPEEIQQSLETDPKKD